MIAIPTAKRFRDWVCSYSFRNTGESFRKLFLTKIAEKDTKHKGSCQEVFCKVETLEDFIGKHLENIGKHLCWSPLLIKLQAEAL